MADSEEASDLLSLLGIDYDLHVGRVLKREEDVAKSLRAMEETRADRSLPWEQ